MNHQTRSFRATPENASDSGLPRKNAMVLRLARWCIAHRRRVVLAWVAVAILATALAGSVGNKYATNSPCPGPSPSTPATS